MAATDITGTITTGDLLALRKELLTLLSGVEQASATANAPYNVSVVLTAAAAMEAYVLTGKTG